MKIYEVTQTAVIHYLRYSDGRIDSVGVSSGMTLVKLSDDDDSSWQTIYIPSLNFIERVYYPVFPQFTRDYGHI